MRESFEKTLYLSDLDGTLLRSDQTLSAYTCSVIDRLAGAGVHFSFATARSIDTAARVTKGLEMDLPVIVHNGAFIVDSVTRRPLWSAKFTPEEEETVYAAFLRRGLFPLTYAVIDGKNRFSYLREKCGKAQWEFVLSRMGYEDDRRAREISSPEEALDGDVYYFACIGDAEEQLSPVYEALKSRFRCIFSRDIYTDAPWLEILPQGVSKATAAEKLMTLLGCDRLICFGDEVNDLPMFEIADERYAVGNAAPELKKLATGVIGCNDEDAVARWLEAHFQSLFAKQA